MKWFGPKWDAPATDDASERVATPVGDECLYCSTLIVDGDQGFRMPFHTMDGSVLGSVHLHCLMKTVSGNPPSAMVSAIRTALTIQSDPTNHFVQCACGVGFMTGAALKDADGRAKCIGCGEPVS